MVVVMNSILVWKSYSEHSLNATLACVAAMQFIYGAEPLFFEVSQKSEREVKATNRRNRFTVKQFVVYMCQK